MDTHNLVEGGGMIFNLSLQHVGYHEYTQRLLHGFSRRYERNLNNISLDHQSHGCLAYDFRK